MSSSVLVVSEIAENTYGEDAAGLIEDLAGEIAVLSTHIDAAS